MDLQVKLSHPLLFKEENGTQTVKLLNKGDTVTFDDEKAQGLLDTWPNRYEPAGHSKTIKAGKQTIEMPAKNEVNLEDFTVKELLQKAKDAGIEVPSSAKKSEIIEALTA